MYRMDLTATDFWIGRVVALVVISFVLLACDNRAAADTWEDARIAVTVGKFEQIEELPKNLPPHLRVPPEAGHNYIKVVINIARTENIYLTSANPLLVDEEGSTYKKVLMGFQGANFTDRHDANSLKYYPPGAVLTGFYEIPEEAMPTNIRINYKYLNSLEEDEEEENGSIDIKI